MTNEEIKDEEENEEHENDCYDCEYSFCFDHFLGGIMCGCKASEFCEEQVFDGQICPCFKEYDSEKHEAEKVAQEQKDAEKISELGDGVMVYKTDNESCYVVLKASRYEESGALALWLDDAETGERFTTLSVNLLEPAENGYMYVNDAQTTGSWDADFIVRNGLGKRSGTVCQGMGWFPCMKINLEKILELAVNRDVAEEILRPMIEKEKADQNGEGV